jgi:predicted nucleic acid-binding protein
MTDQERRKEILKAEEVIRQLAGELTQASKYAALAETARQGLEEARDALKKSTTALSEAAKTVSVSGERASQVLSSTSEETSRSLTEINKQILDEATNALKQSTTALNEAAETVSVSGKHLFQLLNSTSEGTQKSLSELGERLSELLNSTSQETIQTLLEISKQIDVATDRLQAAAQSIEDNPKLDRLISFNRWLIILVAVTLVGGLFNIVIILFR